jgi:hypothetical protein
MAAASPVHWGRNALEMKQAVRPSEPYPRYSSIADASGKGNHHLQVVHLDQSRNVLAEWFETTSPGGLKGHTEAKALSRIKLEPGQSVLFIGEYAPCNYDGGCHELMDLTAHQSGADIVYFELGETGTRSVRFYQGGVGHIRAPGTPRRAVEAGKGR